MKAMITDIKRFAVHDGDGIRTTVFFKGCPMRCVWCHNPEGLNKRAEIAFYEHKCSLCGECTKICNIHKIESGRHMIDNCQCTFCKACEDICPKDALRIYGTEMSVDEIFDIIKKDKVFYENSGGGITLSGGECLMQADFCREILKMCKEYGIRTAIDTSGYAEASEFDKVIPYTDIFLYDIKAYDENVHMKCTGASNKRILKNLEYIDSLGCKIEIRIPYVPDFNDGEIEKIAYFVKNLKNVIRVRILPYHNYAGSKYNALGIKNTLPAVRIPTEEECTELTKKYF